MLAWAAGSKRSCRLGVGLLTYYYWQPLTAIGDKLYFSGFDELHGDELWSSDGTTAGTVFVKDLDPGYRGPEFIESAQVGNRFYFITAVYNPFGGYEQRKLWMSEGRDAPAILLDERLAFSQLYALADQTLLLHRYEGTGPALYRHAGGSAAPTLVKGFGNASLSNQIVLQGRLFFHVNTDSTDPLRINGLWCSDGTTAGTIKLVTAANDGRLGRELWQSNGTTSGTRLVADLYPGAPSADPIGHAVFSDTLYFTADNGVDGQQLFDLRTGVPLALPGEQEPLPPAPYHLYLPITKQ